MFQLVLTSGANKHMNLLLISLALLCTSLLGGGLKVGTASVKITPPPGHPMAGGYGIRLSDGVRDDLLAKAMVLEKDGVKAAFVACDLVALNDAIVEQARERIGAETGVPSENVMMSATHTHSGPVVTGRHAVDPYIGGDMPIAQEFVKNLPVRIAEAVQLAEKSLRPAQVAAGVGHEESVAFNRRFLMKDGSIGWNPGRMNPDIVRPVGPTDPDLGVVHFRGAEEKPVATYVNYPLHVAVAGGTEYSADYPGVIARLLSNAIGNDMLTMFTQGATANVNHIDVENPDQLGGYSESVRIGTILTAEILKTFENLEPVSAESLTVSRKVVELVPAEFDAEDIEEAREVAERMKGSELPPFLERVQAFKVLNVLQRDRRVKAEVQVITLGEKIAWVALPGEVFVELGLAIKEASPFPYTMIVSMANGWISYIPDRKAFAEGNYEAISSLGAPGSGEKLVETAVELLVKNRYGEAFHTTPTASSD